MVFCLKPVSFIAEVKKVFVESEETEAAIFEAAKKLLDDKEKAWAHLYVKVLSKSKTSAQLGLGGESPASHGCMMYARPHVNAYIQLLLNAMNAGTSENIRFIRSVRDTDLNDYLTEKQHVTSDTVKIGLGLYIEYLETELDIENQYFLEYADTKEDQTYSLQAKKRLKKEIGLCKIKLAANPGAFKFVQGPEYLKTEMVLDLVKIHADEEHGRIKSIKHTKEGVQIEMYSATEAAALLAKIDGSLDKNTKGIVANFDFGNAEVVFK